MPEVGTASGVSGESSDARPWLGGGGGPAGVRHTGAGNADDVYLGVWGVARNGRTQEESSLGRPSGESGNANGRVGVRALQASAH